MEEVASKIYYKNAVCHELVRGNAGLNFYEKHSFSNSLLF